MNQKGAIHLIAPILLFLGLIATLYIVTQGSPLKLFSKATDYDKIEFKSSPLDTTPLPTNSNGIPKLQVNIPEASAGVGNTAPFVWVEVTSKNPSQSGNTGVGSSVLGTSIGIGSTGPITSNSCSVCSADVNKDGTVNDQDGAAVKNCFGKRATDKGRNGQTCTTADVDGDGWVNITDFSCVSKQFGQSCQSTTPTPAPSPVPGVVYTTHFQIAESLTNLNNAPLIPYTPATKAFGYTFKDKTHGVKTLFVQFIDSNGTKHQTNKQIEIVYPPTPTPKPTITPTPTPTPTPIVIPNWGMTVNKTSITTTITHPRKYGQNTFYGDSLIVTNNGVYGPIDWDIVVYPFNTTLDGLEGGNTQGGALQQGQSVTRRLKVEAANFFVDSTFNGTIQVSIRKSGSGWITAWNIPYTINFKVQ